MTVELRFTTESARRLRTLLDGAEDASIVDERQDGRPPAAGSVVVRMLTAIAAGSTDAVEAEIMSLVNGVWVGTGQTIRVRSATGLAVTTTGRRIARRVSTWGWCVVET